MEKFMEKIAREKANDILTRLDRVAGVIQQNYAKWGIPFEVAKKIANDLDTVADTVEVEAFGKESFERRRAEVLQKDPDEGYINTFENPMSPIQVEADEPYMAAYKDDQSSAVIHGKATNGRPLT